MTTSNHGDDDQEMSMDEILASIRRYVSPEEPAKKEEPKPAEPLLGSPHVDMNTEPHTQRITPHLDMTHQEETTRLNEASYREERPELREESRQESPLWKEEPVIKSSFDTNRQEPRVTRAPASPIQQNAVPPKANDGLVSEKTLATTIESFSRLRDASLQKAPKQEPTAAPSLNPTLDQLFESLARPMIREWLDRNLPPMVERMVTREIERITKG